MIRENYYKYLEVFVILVLIYGFLGAFAITKGTQWAHNKSQEYLREGKKSTNDADSFLLFEKAAILDATEDTYLNAGITALKLGKNELAERYLGRVKTAEGYFQLASAYYNIEKYDRAVQYFEKANQNKQTVESYVGLAKSFLRQGKTDYANTALKQANSIQPTEDVSNLLALLVPVSKSSEPANRSVVVYNELFNLGYPQSADNILYKAVEDGFVTRDSLIKMAIEQIEHGDYPGAYNFLTRAKTIDPYYPQIYKQLIIVCEELGKSNEAVEYQTLYNNLVI